MSFYRELFIILLMSFVGEAISYLFNLPIPGSVIGMILMFAALQAKIIKVDDVRGVGAWLLGNMSVLFLPATVGIMACVATVKSVLLPLIVIIAVTVVVNIFVIGRVVQFVKMRFEGDYVDSAGVVRAPTTEKETENDSSSND